MQEARRTPPLQDRSELPSEIERVLHGNVHALTCFRAVRVARVTGDEHAAQARLDLLFRYVIELVAQPLADFVNRPPGDFFHLEREWPEYPPGLRNQIVGGDVAA